MKILLSSMCPLVGQSFQSFINHFYDWFGMYLIGEKCEFRFLLKEEYFVENLKQHIFDNLNPIILTNNEEKIILPDSAGGKNWYNFNGLNDVEKGRLKEFLDFKLGNWTPDIIISQGISSENFWNGVYPNAMCLIQENGIFSRSPYPRTLSYDPFSTRNTFLNRFSKDILSIKIDEKQKNSVKKFKKELVALLEKNNSISGEIVKIKEKFRKTVLLPLSGNFINHYMDDSKYTNDFDLLEYVLKNVPQDIGVFVTESDLGGILNDDVCHYFEKRYPHFIFMKRHQSEKYYASSLPYLSHIDAILNLYSKTGITGLLYDKPIIDLTYSSNTLIKDGNLADLERVLSGSVQNKDNILYWYFTHYITFPRDYGKEKFLWNFLNTKLEKFRNHGIKFDFFEQVNDFDDVADYVLNSVKDFYAPKKIEQPLLESPKDKDVINQRISALEEKALQFEKFLKRPSFFEYQRVRLLSHITFGKMKRHYGEKKKNYKQYLQ